jgi:hydroxymethylpyrimidine kinase/phosphomethylpyrimidine kinase/thiamine-phosphate diphosphorylase
MIAGLYLITDDDRDGRLLQRVAAALRGGVRTVQYRSKTGAAGGDPATARRLADLCRAAGATRPRDGDGERLCSQICL